MLAGSSSHLDPYRNPPRGRFPLYLFMAQKRPYSVIFWPPLGGPEITHNDLLRLDVGRTDHLSPLLGFGGDEFAESARRHLTWLNA
jgi:hypothetical protein